MKLEDIIADLNESIINNDIKSTLNRLYQLISTDSLRYNEIIALLNRYSEYQALKRSNTESYDTVSQVRSKLLSDVQDFIGTLRQEDFSKKRVHEFISRENRGTYLKLTLGALIIALGVISWAIYTILSFPDPHASREVGANVSQALLRDTVVKLEKKVIELGEIRIRPRIFTFHDLRLKPEDTVRLKEIIKRYPQNQALTNRINWPLNKPWDIIAIWEEVEHYDVMGNPSFRRIKQAITRQNLSPHLGGETFRKVLLDTLFYDLQDKYAGDGGPPVQFIIMPEAKQLSLLVLEISANLAPKDNRLTPGELTLNSSSDVFTEEVKLATPSYPMDIPLNSKGQLVVCLLMGDDDGDMISFRSKTYQWKIKPLSFSNPGNWRKPHSRLGDVVALYYERSR